MRYQRGSFVVVPSKEVLRGMPVPAQALYMWLCAYANETGECFPARSTLARDLDCSLNTVDRFTQLLIDRGLLKVEKRFKNNEKITNLYTLLIVDGGSPTDEQPSPTDEQGVAPQIDIELYPVLTQPTYLCESEIREENDFSYENDEESKKRRSTAKYPHSKEVFSWFPRPQKSWTLNTTELKHAELLWERGEKRVKAVLDFVAEQKESADFLYTVIKPSDLERKWEDIRNWKVKQGL